MRNRTRNKSIDKKNSAGFTLMEIVVVLAVFSTTALIAVDLFLSVTKVQRQVRSVQAVQSDARFALESMVKEARSGTIDYGYYQANCIAGDNIGDPCTEDADCKNGGTNSCGSIDLSNPTDILVTRDQDNNQVFYKLNSDDPNKGFIEVCSNSHIDLTRCNLMVNDTPQDNWQTVSPPNVKINKLEFYIFPATSPFSTEAVGCTQDSECSPGKCVNSFCTYDFQPSVTIVLESEGLEEGSEKVNLQTTASSIFYKR